MRFGLRYTQDFHSAENNALTCALEFPDFNRRLSPIPCSCDHSDGSHRSLAAIGMEGNAKTRPW